MCCLVELSLRSDKSGMLNPSADQLILRTSQTVLRIRLQIRRFAFQPCLLPSLLVSRTSLYKRLCFFPSPHKGQTRLCLLLAQFILVGLEPL